MAKIVTPEQARREQAKPWTKDLSDMANQIRLMMQRNDAGLELEISHLRADMLLMLGEFDEFFNATLRILQNPVCNATDVKLIIDTWEKVVHKLSKDFLDKYEQSGKYAIEVLEKVRTLKGFNKKQCNKILNILYMKKESKNEDVQADIPLESKET